MVSGCDQCMCPVGVITGRALDNVINGQYLHVCEAQ